MTSATTTERFRRVRCLGEGGMGIVYEAIDRERGTPVALKTLRHMTAEALAKLKREFRAMQDLHHPNLVSLGELVSEGDQWFFTMELVSGVEFLEHVRSKPALDETDPNSHISEQSLRAGPTLALDAAPQAAPLFDNGRLRGALRQLAGALCAMHATGLVHRDIKSSNVRVTADGRVVLLDFGLVIGTNNDTAWTQQVAGTPAYMAPEQASSAAVGPEADWYGLGVLLFEALTGQLPFDGPVLEVLARKQRERPAAPATLAQGVPDDLNELCVRLLSIDPAARPKGTDVLLALGLSSTEATASATQTQTKVFVGRTAELDKLMAAFHDSRRGAAPVAIMVEGESGVGKSALVRRFAQRLSFEVPDAVVLAGRCYERESVPYKAFDGVIDALSRLLTVLGPEAEGMVPTKPAPLAKVFPVLRRVKAIAEGTRGQNAEIEGLELRTRAFASLREMFTRLADRRPLVVMIDDAQWTDADSLVLLADLLRPPEAPAMMLLLTGRSDVSPQSTGDQPSRSLTEILKGDLRRIELGPLPEQDATALASRLLERSGVVDATRAQRTAQQAAGHPLFIDMIMRRHDRLPSGDGAELRLEDVLWAVIEELDPAPRAILETLAVAAAPVSQEIARKVASLASETFSKAISLLRVTHLVQTTRSGREDGVEPYHDRVRKAVLNHLETGRRAEYHRRIAVALETSEHPDPEALVVHWRGAGEREQTTHYAVLAGDRAAGALAFDRAADFFKLALTKEGMSVAERRTLLVKLAKVLESAGRGEDAAHAYLQAAEGAPPLQRVDLERAASVELMASGRLDEGATVLRRVLAAVGVSAPRSTIAAFCWLMVYSAWLRITGLRFKPRPPDEIRREDLARIDALFAAATGFAMVDLVLASCMAAQHLIAALRSGDRFRVLRATVLQASRLAGAGGTPSWREGKLSEVATSLLAEQEDAEVRAFFDSTRGYSLYVRGQWRNALSALDSTISRAQSHSHFVRWRSNDWLFGCWTLDLLGEYRELSQRHARYLADAERRGDLYASVQLRVGSMSGVWLAADRPEEGRRNAQEAIAQWPSTRYVLQHWQFMVGEAETELYLGNAAAAYARVERDAAPLKKSLLLHTQIVSGKTLFLRGRCAIASLEADPVQRGARLAETRKLARKLESTGMPWMMPLAAILTAAAANAEGNRSSAAGWLRIAAERADGADMSGYAHAARHQLGLLLGDDEGRELGSRAREALAAQGVQAPARFASMLVPGRWAPDADFRSGSQGLTVSSTGHAPSDP